MCFALSQAGCAYFCSEGAAVTALSACAVSCCRVVRVVGDMLWTLPRTVDAMVLDQGRAFAVVAIGVLVIVEQLVVIWPQVEIITWNRIDEVAIVVNCIVLVIFIACRIFPLRTAKL